MFNKLLGILKEPFPQQDSLREFVQGSLIAAVLVIFILIGFRPFGFSEPDIWTAVYYSFIFGIITLIVVFSYECFLKYVLRLKRGHPSWTLGKWLFSNLMIGLCITTANYFFTVYAYGLPHSWWHLLGIFRSAVIIGILPLTIIGLLIILRSTKQHEKIASGINWRSKSTPDIQESNLIKLPTQQSEKFFEIQADQIICVEAMQNYVHIHYHQEDEIHKKTIRNTLSSIEKILSGTEVRRSHRSFLVNTNRIEKVSGNAQGLKLEINPSPGFWVPVSRKYIPAFKQIA